MDEDLRESYKPSFDKMFIEFMKGSGKSFNCDDYKRGDFSCLNNHYRNLFLDALISKDNIPSEDCFIMVSLIIYEKAMHILDTEVFDKGRNDELGNKEYIRAFDHIFTGYESEDSLIIKMLKSDVSALSKSIHWDKIQPIYERISLGENNLLNRTSSVLMDI